MAVASPPASPRSTRTRRARRRTFGALASVAAVLLLLVGPLAGVAAAHADVVAFEPSPAEVLDRSPETVKIWFSEGVNVNFGGVFVYDDQGNRVDVGRLRQPTPEKLVLPIRGELPDGSYIVTWRAVSEDGHPLQGTWTFHVGDSRASTSDVDAVAAGLLADQRADRAVAIGWAVARWVVFAAMALLVGGVVFAGVVWPSARDARATRRLVTAGWVALTAATAVGALLFGAYSRGGGLRDMFDLGVLRDTLDTRFGHVWLLRLAVLVVAFVLLRVFFAHRPAATRPLPDWWLPVAAVAGVVLVSTPGMAGHASTGDHRVLALLSDSVHVAAMAVWVGGLVVLAAAVLSDDDLDAVRTASRRFSRVALACVGVLIVTGAFQTWRALGGLDALRDDEYGRILVVKLVVFAVMLVVATFGREITARLFPREAVGTGAPEDPAPEDPAPEDPAPDPTRDLHRLRRSVWAEVALGALVLLVTALLVNSAPPADATSTDSGAAGVTIEDGRVTLAVRATPGVAGANDLHVNTSSPAGTPLAVDAVEMTLARPGRNLAPLAVPLRQLGPGHYLSPGLDIPLTGTWEVRATVRTGPVDRVDLTGDLEIR